MNAPDAMKQVLAAAPDAAQELRRLKDTMACLTAGVVVVTTHHDGQDWGLTCSSFTSVSLEPPLVLWCLRMASASAAAFTHPGDQGGGYTVSVLGADQAGIAQQFASGTPAERFAGVDVLRLPSGRPRIAGAVAWFDCTLDSALLAGDHHVLVGRVTDYGSAAGAGLVYTQRRFGRVADAG